MSIEKDYILFLGIGGIGMSALARFFNSQGKKVWGYDRTPSPLTHSLALEGIEVFYEDAIEKLPEEAPELVVYTPAIPKQSSLLKYCQKMNWPMEKRAKVLGDLSKDYFTIAVAGTHGKTSITSMITHILKNAGLPVSAFVGGICKNYNSNLVLSKNAKYLVVEADEFDRSFLNIHPNIAIISSMDADHLDIYGSQDFLQESFNLFAAQIQENGSLYLHQGLELKNPISATTYYYGKQAAFSNTSIQIKNGRHYFSIQFPKNGEIKVDTFLPGQHNMDNLSAAAAVALALGLSNQQIAEGISTYSGVQRRYDIKYMDEKHIYIDDYAHHPTEIAATLKAVREMYPSKQILSIFQPHLFSRTRDFMDDFAKVLSLSDEVFLLDIYPAREEPIEGINSQALLNKLNLDQKELVDFENVVKKALNSNKPIILSLGAGSIDRIVEPLKNALSQ